MRQRPIILSRIAGLFICLLAMAAPHRAMAQHIRFVDAEGQPETLSSVRLQIDATGKEPARLTLDSVSEYTVPANYFRGSTSIRIRFSALGCVPVIVFMGPGDTKQVYMRPSEETEVVVTGQYGEGDIASAVQKIRVINSAKIEGQAAVNLKDVLSFEMNISVNQDAMLGAGINMQGLSGENVKIMIDGVPIIGRLDGQLDLSQINMANIERIEIVEGPMSVSYGSNALAGTINLITKKDIASTAHGRVGQYYESGGHFNSSAELGIGLFKNKTPLRLNLARNFFDGWNPGDKPFKYEVSGPADLSRYQQWKPKEQYQADLSVGLPTRGATTYLTGSYFDEVITNRGMPQAPYFEVAADDIYHTNRLGLNLQARSKGDRRYDYQLVGGVNYYTRRKTTYVADLTTMNKTLSRNNDDNDTTTYLQYMSRGSTFRTVKNKPLTTELGYDFNVEQARGLRIDGGMKTIGDFALYATTEYTRGNLTVRPGLRLAYNTSFGAPVTPSLNIRYTSLQYGIFRVSAARGYRAPNVKELYFYFIDVNHYIVGNSSLSSETSFSFSADYQYNWQPCSKFYLQFDAGAYYNDLQNMITLGMIDATRYSYINIGRQRTRGLKFSMRAPGKVITPVLGGNMLSTLQYGAPGYVYTPEFNGGLLIAISPIKAVANIYVKYTGRRYNYVITQEEILRGSIAPFTNADMTLSGPLTRSERLKYNVGVRNMLNVQTLESSGMGASGTAHSGGTESILFGTGRQVFMKLEWLFGPQKQK